MISYTKSLLAVGLALLAVLGAAMWVYNQQAALDALVNERRESQARIGENRLYATPLPDLERRQQILADKIAAMTEQFAEKDREEPLMVKTIVAATSQSGMEMTHLSRNNEKCRVLQTQPMWPPIHVVAYEVSLRGPYHGLVKFLRHLATGKVNHKIEALTISAPPAGQAAGSIETEIMFLLFSVEKKK